MSNIIGFCGRKGSGKTELAKICEEFGYKRLYFAEPIKRIISSLLSCTIDELNMLKTVNKKYTFGTVDIAFIAKETDIPIDYLNSKLKNVVFNNVREIMQYLGTDVIRDYDTDWHVKKVREQIKEGEKYVIDDVRFPNEAAMVNDLGGDLWFVTRPTFEGLSNHESENSISWQEIDSIIVNDKSLDYLLFHWRMFMENGYNESFEKRTKVVNKLYDYFFNDKPNKLAWDDYFTITDSLMIHKDEFMYDPSWKLSIKEIKKNEDEKTITVTYEDGRIEMSKNALQIEDYKMMICR